MDFNLDEVVINESGTQYMAAGIQEDVVLTGAEMEEVNGTYRLVLAFKNGKGEEFTHREFEVNSEKITPKNGETKEEAVKRFWGYVFGRIKHLRNRLLSNPETNINSTSWKGLLENFTKALKDEIKKTGTTRKHRLKLVYNSKDYSSIPMFPPFIESMDTTEEERTLHITDRDKVVKTSKKMEETSDFDSPVMDDMEVEVEEGAEDAPF